MSEEDKAELLAVAKEELLNGLAAKIVENAKQYYSQNAWECTSQKWRLQLVRAVAKGATATGRL